MREQPTGTRKSVARFSCLRCSKTLKSIATLRQHKEVCFQSNAAQRWTCVVCSKQFRTQIQRTRHVYYVHGGRSFTCTHSGCDRTFSSNSHLLAHMATHTADRPFPCKVVGCLYRARNASRLEQHMATHDQGRRFSCDYCDYRATTSSNLRRHARLHAGARPYHCPHCNHCTSELNALRKHVLDSGRHPGLFLYVCPWCTPPPSTETDKLSRQKSCVGFNASGMVWRHLVSEHATELARAETIALTGKTQKDTLSERDVTRLLGLYKPQADRTQPIEGEPVRQPAVLSHYRRRTVDSDNTTDTTKSFIQNSQENCLSRVVILSSNQTSTFSSPRKDFSTHDFGSADASNCVSRTAVGSSTLLQIGCGALWTSDHLIFQ